MSRILIVAAAGLVAACQQMPQSKEPSAAPSASQAGGNASAATSSQVRSSIQLRGSAGAGSSAPVRTGSYPAAVIKDLVIAASDRKNLRDDERAQFELIKPELSRAFGSTFRDALRRAGYVQTIVGDDTVDAVVIEATLTEFIAPTNRGTMAGIHTGTLEFTVTVSDATGNRLGSYQLHYQAFLRANTLPAMDVQRTVFPDAGTKVAEAIAKAK